MEPLRLNFAFRLTTPAPFLFIPVLPNFIILQQLGHCSYQGGINRSKHASRSSIPDKHLDIPIPSSCLHGHQAPPHTKSFFSTNMFHRENELPICPFDYPCGSIVKFPLQNSNRRIRPCLWIRNNWYSVSSPHQVCKNYTFRRKLAIDEINVLECKELDYRANGKCIWAGSIKPAPLPDTALKQEEYAEEQHPRIVCRNHAGIRGPTPGGARTVD
jgi:hypothetical protein